MPHQSNQLYPDQKYEWLGCISTKGGGIIGITIKLIWRHWTYKMPVRYILASVWVRYSIFSQLSIIQYAGLCVFSLPISLVMIERINILCLIIIIKSKVWTITHCLGLGHETMVCAVCLSIFLSIGFTVFSPAQDLNDYVEGKCVQNRWNGYVDGENVSRTGEMIMLRENVSTTGDNMYPER